MLDNTEQVVATNLDRRLAIEVAAMVVQVFGIEAACRQLRAGSGYWQVTVSGSLKNGPQILGFAQGYLKGRAAEAT